MKRPARRKASPKAAVRKTAAAARGNGTTLSERIAIAPRLLDPKMARNRVTQWLSELGAVEAKQIKALLASRPTVNTLLESLAESSPYLWELASREPERLLRLFHTNPARHLTPLLTTQSPTPPSPHYEPPTLPLL